jgi:hypothetical protein
VILIKETNFETKKRLFFLDNFRTTVIFLVILLHVSIAYSVNCPEWWWVISPQNHFVFDIFSLILDRIVMPLIFFVAGYFALYSIIKYDVVNYLKKRLKRLGIPLLIGLIFVAPIVVYIKNLYRQDYSNNFFYYLIYDYFPEELNSVHLWFLISLIIFSVIFALIYSFKKKYFKPKNQNSDFYSSVTFLFLFGFLVSLVFFIINFILGDSYWLVIQNFAVFQATRFALDISFFFLGILAFKNQWFNRKYSGNNLYYWSISTLLIIGCTLLLYNYYYPELLENPVLLFVDSILFVFLCITSLKLLLNISLRLFNKPSKIWDKFAPNSYSIYIFHYPIVFALQYYFIDINISLFIKAIIILFTSLILSFIISEYFIRRIPYLKKVF